jgi:hypothetical protein
MDNVFACSKSGINTDEAGVIRLNVPKTHNMNENKPIYTDAELRGMFITCYKVIAGNRHTWDAVRYASGPRSGLPILYNSIKTAREDKYFSEYWDEVVPADEYFRRVNSEIKQ